MSMYETVNHPRSFLQPWKETLSSRTFSCVRLIQQVPSNKWGSCRFITRGYLNSAVTFASLVHCSQWTRTKGTVVPRPYVPKEAVCFPIWSTLNWELGVGVGGPRSAEGLVKVAMCSSGDSGSAFLPFVWFCSNAACEVKCQFQSISILRLANSLDWSSLCCRGLSHAL